MCYIATFGNLIASLSPEAIRKTNHSSARREPCPTRISIELVPGIYLGGKNESYLERPAAYTSHTAACRGGLSICATAGRNFRWSQRSHHRFDGSRASWRDCHLGRTAGN